LDVASEDLEPFAFASHAYPEFHLLMPLYFIRRWTGDLRLDPNAAQAVAWAAPASLRDYAMPPADVVLVDRLLEWSAAQ